MLQGLDEQTASIYTPIKSRLNQVEERLSGLTQSSTTDLKPLLEHVLTSGGKRVRPALTLLASDLKSPVHAETADMDGDGDIDVLVSSMGFVFPNNDRIGFLYALENDGQQNFSIRPLLENVARVTDARAGDFNGDGHLDIAVAQFGYDQGEVRWMERTGPWQYESHKLLDLSGAINVCVADMDGDGSQDIVANSPRSRRGWMKRMPFANAWARHCRSTSTS